MSARHNHHQEDHDEAMEWITDWDYERILPSSGEHQHHNNKVMPTMSAAANYDDANNHHLPTDHRHDDDDDDDVQVEHAHGHPYGNDHTGHVEESNDDASMDVMDEDDDEDAPLPLDHAEDPHHHDSSQEIAIFWTRASEQLTDDDLNGMFGDANADHPAVSRRNSRLSLMEGMLDVDETMEEHEEEEDDDVQVKVVVQEVEGSPATPIAVESSVSTTVPQPPLAPEGDDEEEKYDDDDDDDDDVSIMGPLHEKEGLLPPMSPSQLYHQGNAQYGMIESHKMVHDNCDVKGATSSFPDDSTGTHTTMDLMDDEDEDEGSDHEEEGEDASPVPVTTTSSHHAFAQQASAAGGSDAIFERQQQLLQQVLQQAPSSSATRRPTYELPRPSDHQQRLLQEMKERPTKKRASASEGAEAEATAASPAAASPKEEDPIFARQQEIFQQLRKQNQDQKNEQQQAQDSKLPPSHYVPYPPYHPHHPPYHYPSSTGVSASPYYPHSSSPVSVTKTLTRAGMDSEEYQKVVTRLTEKNLIERQRYMLQESMKRSLETRQALHIKPTALPDYNHDKLTRVLQDIESSTRSISETYGRR